MTENGKARELIATSETTVKVDPQNGWYLKRFAALQFEGSVDNFGTNMPIHVLEQQLPKEDTMKLDDAVIKCGNTTFIATAHVTQTWLVDEDGDFIEAKSDCDEVTHAPDAEDLFTCSKCGEEVAAINV
jgi:hypothetical protein